MIILGIDPGYAIVGYGAIDFYKAKYKALGYGAIFTSSKDEFSNRLNKIYENMVELIKCCKPEAVAIESLYFQNNQKTAMLVSQARGVILLACNKMLVPIYEYTPLQVKTSVTGYGKANKTQVMGMVKKLLRLEEVPKPDDTADALAIAVCHANSRGSNTRKNVIDKLSDNKILTVK